MKKQSNKNKQYVDYFIFITLIIVFISGILIRPFEQVILFKILHGISSLLFVLGCGIHIFQHRQILGRKNVTDHDKIKEF